MERACTPDRFLFDHQKRLVFHGRINDATDPEAIPKIPIMKNNVKKSGAKLWRRTLIRP